MATYKILILEKLDLTGLRGLNSLLKRRRGRKCSIGERETGVQGCGSSKLPSSNSSKTCSNCDAYDAKLGGAEMFITAKTVDGKMLIELKIS